jgi:hypothetical protein
MFTREEVADMVAEQAACHWNRHTGFRCTKSCRNCIRMDGMATRMGHPVPKWCAE